MKVSELCTIGTSGAARGFKQDASTRPQIKKREDKRKAIEQANEFAATMASICPEYFGGGK